MTDEVQRIKDQAAKVKIKGPPEEVAHIALLMRSLAEGMEYSPTRIDSKRNIRMLRQWAEIIETADYE